MSISQMPGKNSNEVSKGLKNIKKIAFVREGGLGDILMTIPVVKAFIEKNKKVDYFTLPKYFPLLRNINCNAEDINNFDEKKNKNQYDRIFDLRNQLENFRIPLNQQHRIDAIAEYCKIKLENKTIGYVPGIEARNWAERFFEQFISPKVVTIGLAWRSAFRVRSWPDMYAYSFCKLFDPLYYKIVLLGENGNYRFSASSVIDTCGYLQIEQTAAVIQKLDILVTNDNGLLHLGGNFDVPLIALFGSLPPEWRIKYYEKCRVIVNNELGCIPCNEWQQGSEKDKYYCLNVDVRCMSLIKPLQVYHETMKYLEEL